jgi:hypothetical protein
MQLLYLKTSIKKKHNLVINQRKRKKMMMIRRKNMKISICKMITLNLTWVVPINSLQLSKKQMPITLMQIPSN